MCKEDGSLYGLMSARPEGHHGDSGAAILQVSCKQVRTTGPVH